MSSKQHENDEYSEEKVDADKPPRQGILENFSLLKEMMKFDETKNEFQAADTDWLLLRGDLLRELFEGLRAFLGRGANIAIKAAGKNSGRRFVMTLLNRGMEIWEAESILNMLINQGGWGKAEIKIDVKTNKATISITNCVTARKTTSAAPSCHFLTGYFEGFCGMLFNVETECVEIACKASGDPACMFHVKPEETKNSKHHFEVRKN